MPVNTRGFSSCLKYYSILVISTRKIVVASLGVILSKLSLDMVIFILFIDRVLAYFPYIIVKFKKVY